MPPSGTRPIHCTRCAAKSLTHPLSEEKVPPDRSLKGLCLV